MDKSYFNAFIFSNANKIYYYVFCILKNHEETLMVVSKTMEECWEKRSDMDLTDLYQAFKIAGSLARIKALSNQSSQCSVADFEQSEEVDPLLKKFCLLLKDLSSLESEVICLRSLARLSIEEISVIVEVGISNVISILSSSRKLMRNKVDPLGCLNEFSCHELLSKYYLGTTTIEEEEQLRLFLSRMDLTEIPKTDGDLLRMFLKIGNADIPISGSDFLLKQVKELQSDKSRKIFSKFKKQS
ncbi:hypothetical protein [Marinifilum sp.]|uniref:hypothetical protein n=1 Tax=Marinifilum sp. TaxID=2033137 RepID=UPI003BACE0E6